MEALVKKGLAVCDLIDNETKASTNGFATVSSTDSEAIVTDESDTRGQLSPSVEHLFSDLNQVYGDICKLIDPYDQKVAKLSERHAIVHKHFGRALKVLAKVHESKASEENEWKTISVLERLDWTHVSSALNRSLAVKYPNSYRLL